MPEFKPMRFIHVVGYLSTAFLLVYGAVSLIQDTFGPGLRLGSIASALAAPIQAPVQVERQAAKATLRQQAQNPSVPQILNYAGELRDSAGQLVSGAYTMTFRIYATKDAEPSQALWEEAQGGVVVQNGRFALVLGKNDPITPTVFSGPVRYLGLSVESAAGGSPISEDTPNLRKRFAMVPFAAHAGYASALMAVDGDPLDALIVNNDGNIGIGTDPTHKFHVLAEDAVGLFESTGTQAFLRLSTKEGIDHRVEIANRPGGILALYNPVKGDVFNITRDGNVGIGTNEPALKLDIKGDFGRQDGPTTISLWGSRIGDNGGGVLFLDSGGGAIAFNGNVGIGTNEPALKLDIKGDFGRQDGPATISLWGSRIGDNGGGILFLDSGGGAIAFNDNVGIGITNPRATLDVNGDIRGKLQYTGEFVWEQGEDWKQLIHRDSGFCFLTAVRGNFAGGGEHVLVEIQGDHWVLGGFSQQTGVRAVARCAGIE